MKSPGQQITDILMEHPERRNFEVTLERKAAGPILVAPASATTVPVVVPGPILPLRMRDLIPNGRTSGGAILYVRETSFTSSPIAPIKPGDLKPQADLTYEVQLQPVITIPAYMKLPKQYWQDFAMFQSWMDSRLLYGLAQTEEGQLLNGNGVAPNLQGFMLVALAAPPLTAPPAGAGAVLAGVASGIAFLYGNGYMPTGIVLNPNDFGVMLLSLGTPEYVTTPVSLWGIPVVVSKAMPSGSYLVGQFNPFSQIFDREEVAVEVADNNEDDFIKNLVTVRAEERLALAIYQPAAFAKGTFTLP
jgi:HK97 family phage major capsid protein